VAPAGQADVLDSLDREEHAQDLARDPDSVHDLVRRAVCCPDRAKAPQRVVLRAVLLRGAAATSATRRPRKAR